VRSPKLLTEHNAKPQQFETRYHHNGAAQTARRSIANTNEKQALTAGIGIKN
jgi:hypothetical protein